MVVPPLHSIVPAVEAATNTCGSVTVTAVAVAGIFIGSKLGEKMHGEKLKKGFGWFVLIMGIYIIFKEITAL